MTVNDGYLIFRWWLPHPIQTKTDEKKTGKRSNQPVKSRISIQLSGCDWHYFYNEGIYGNSKDETPKGSSGSLDWLWDLCPYFEIQVLYGRIIMGNPSLPYSLTVRVTNRLNHFCLIFQEVFWKLCSKIEILIENGNFWSKIEILVENRNYWWKFRFLTKISILTKKSILDQNLDSVQNRNFLQK